MRPSTLPCVLALGLFGAMLASCSSGDGVGTGDGGTDAPADAGLPEDYVPIQKTLSCTGDETACLSGTFALKDFTGKPTATKVTLFKLFPRGDVQTIGWVPVAKDGTFAFSGLAAWGHYYLQGEARFGGGDKATAVTSNVGSFSVPAAREPIPIVVRPVFLEILQEAPAGQPTFLGWASAHLYDPKSGAEVTHGDVALTANGTTSPMPYGTNANGTQSFNVALASSTPGGTSFTISTSYPELGPSPVTWNLVGDPATFGGSITSPTSSSVPKNTPLTVTWQAQPMASFTQTELFIQQGASYVQRYISPTVNAPDVTTETIPASALGTSGSYLLNEDYSNATCPAAADGCVYNLSTAAMSLTID